MLHRIPAVKWALTRLRPSPHGGGIDAAPIAANDSPALIVDAAETAPAPSVSISADPLPSDADVAVAADEATISVVAEGPSAAPTDESITDDSCRETPTEAEPVVVAETAISPADLAPESTNVPEFIIDNDPPAEDSADVAPDETEQAVGASVEAERESVNAEPIAISRDPSPELPTGIEPVVAEETEAVSVDGAIAPVDALVVNDDHSPGIPADVEPAVADALCVALGVSEAAVEDVSESGIDNAPSSSDAVEIEPVPANDPAPVVAAAATESSSDDTPGIVTDIAPEQDLRLRRPMSAAHRKFAPSPRNRPIVPR
ncbi:hypothetical protein [Bradyrhizobium sp. CB1717]|uniref:hypothetical protein n=1 Tax=Bradyrhizobium sp. CB1717 TaxID=3039154 RepID=UPI0032C22788